MKTRVRRLWPALILGLLILVALVGTRWLWPKSALTPRITLRKEPVYQGRPLSFWVRQVGRIQENSGAPKDAVAAIRAGYGALLQASNAPSSWPGIGDIIYEVQAKMSRGNAR